MSERPLDAKEAPIRDLPDFHLRWPEFRPDAVRVMQGEMLSAREREVLLWLIRMADKIGARDLGG